MEGLRHCLNRNAPCRKCPYVENGMESRQCVEKLLYDALAELEKPSGLAVAALCESRRTEEA